MKPVQKISYGIIWPGNPMLHEELMWYATDDDRVVGAVIRDRTDNDYGWVVLMRLGNIFRCVDVDTSLPSVTAATAALHAAMEEANAEGDLC